MQDLSDHLNLINFKQLMTTKRCMLERIHLDNNTFSILFLIKERYVLLYYLDFYGDCVHIYKQINLNYIIKTVARSWAQK
jgi:hypothetical protein